MSADPADVNTTTRVAEKHLLGFAVFGWAWPALTIAWRVLGWIIEVILIVALAIVDTSRRVRLRVR